MAILEGTAYWASIKTPNTKFTPTYSIDLVVDSDTANEFASRGHKIKQEYEEGPALVIKRKVTDYKGRPNAVPRLYDQNKQEVNLAVGNGSKVKVQYDEYHGSNDFGDYHGLDLKAVQILNLVEYNASGEVGSEFFEDGEEF